MTMLKVNNMKIIGGGETRYITKIKVNPRIIKIILSNVGKSNISFNLMLITTDHRVMLMERTESHHFPRVIKDLKSNIINLNLLDSLYTSELEKIKNKIGVSTRLDDGLALGRSEGLRIDPLVLIFPGGHPSTRSLQQTTSKASVSQRPLQPSGRYSKRETVITTLLRELHEETRLNINLQDLRFNQSYIFNVVINDLMIKKSFNNLVFPVKLNMSSLDITREFKETKHVRNPTFIDIKDCRSLSEVFLLVQKIIIL